jgi:hypothetical protein
MARNNANDHRLDRMAATIVMLMEALRGLDHKYVWSAVGHSGEEIQLPLIDFGAPPSDQSERTKVIHDMYAHATNVNAGDSTLAAANLAIQSVTAEEGDDYLVFVLSDANLELYGISPRTYAQIYNIDPRVSCFSLFVAGEVFGEQVKQLEPKNTWVLLDTAALPRVFKDIFAVSLLNQ